MQRRASFQNPLRSAACGEPSDSEGAPRKNDLGSAHLRRGIPAGSTTTNASGHGEDTAVDEAMEDKGAAALAVGGGDGDGEGVRAG